MDPWREKHQKLMADVMDDSDDEHLAYLLHQQSTTLLHCLKSRSLKKSHGGSQKGKRANLQRYRQEGHEWIWRDYFCKSPVYSDATFRRRYRMTRQLFNKILADVCAHDNYFVQRRDCTNRLGLSSVQKITAAVRMLAYGLAADATDEYCRIGESTAMECLKRFVRAIRELYEPHYLRQPSKEDILKQMDINDKRGFLGMFGSLDCMHYRWKNCPVAWQAMYQDKDKNRSIILEAVADQSLHIWHAYFGLPGSNNYLNVLDRSPLVTNLLKSDAEDITFQVNGHTYPRYYLLVDGIYPKWAIFVQTIHEPQGAALQYFASMQEFCRKDVERAFGVLQARFAIVRNPSRVWDPLLVKDILMASVVLHNMIIEDELDAGLETLVSSQPQATVRHGLTFQTYLEKSFEVENTSTHYILRNDLVNHLWAVKGHRGE